jgi:glycosyltransferase involved in cell wall biosynthesis
VNESVTTPDLTVMILSFNEEIHIRRCIERIRPIARRIVVIDSLSTDATQDIARQMGADVYERRFTYHADQLRWGLDKAKIDTAWVIWIACDEYLQPALLSEIQRRLPSLPKSVSAIELKLRLVFQGKWIRWGGYYRTLLIRLWRPEAAGVEDKLMDERIVARQGEVVRFSDGDLIDENLNDIAHWTEKHNGYSTKHMVQFIEAEYGLGGSDGEAAPLTAQGRKKRFMRDNVYAGAPLYLRAVLYFIYRYFFLLGFLDGRRGFVWHTLQGFWHMLLIDVKVGEARRYIAHHGIDAFRAHVARRYGIAMGAAAKSVPGPTTAPLQAPGAPQ